MFGLTSGNKKPKFIGPKAMNRQQLLIQNLIFIFIAVIIIIILGYLVISNLAFLVEQIDLSLRVRSGDSKVQSFNVEGLESIKGKFPILSPGTSPASIAISTIPFSTNTELIITPTATPLSETILPIE